MSNFQPTEFRTSIGRMLWGNLYEPKMEDFEGNPLKPNKDGTPNTGNYEFGLAIPKNPGETHWANSPLGAVIWAQGHKDHSASAPRPDFSWKVVDGDSAIAGKPYKGKPGRAPKDKEGYPGNWVFSFRGSYAPKIVNANGSAYLLDKDVVMPGDCIQVFGSVVGNTGATPGVYLNYAVVSYQGRHRDGRLSTAGPDPTTLGFGQDPKPAWMTDVPQGNTPPPPAGAGATPPPPAFNGATPPPPPAQQGQQVPQVPVTPAAGFVPTGTPPPPPAQQAAVPPPPPAGPVMTPKAGGNSYATFIAGGWTDATLRSNGYMV